MNAIGIFWTLLNGFLLLRLPRRWAPLPLLMGGLFMTSGQVLEIGPAHFTVIRLLIAVGLFRVMTRREWISGGLNTVDRLMILWAVCASLSSIFHNQVSSALVFRLGLAYEYVGLYLLMRVFVQGLEDFLFVSKMLVLLLVPLAAEMLMEKSTDRNWFGSLGGIHQYAEIRNGRVRAQGPFAHSIFAGTAGAVCLPLALLFWRRDRKAALVGIAATFSIIFASASSGPILTAATVLGALGLWKVRDKVRAIRWLAVCMIFGLNIVMNDPVYYLMARVDLAGGSTGYYRAALIDAAIRHFGEWWFAGTDYTGHWMPTGVVSGQADIVNHYIAMGVMGGLLLMMVFIGILTAAFVRIGKALRASASSPEQFAIWTMGSILFAHATTFMSVSYYDQSTLLLNWLLAGIGSLPVLQTVPALSEAGSIENQDLSYGNAGRSAYEVEPNEHNDFGQQYV